MDTKEVLRQVRKIDLAARRPVEGIIAGSYRSVFRGTGIEFSEIRDYRPGDDIRAIDWKVTARFNHPFIKQFIEERDLNAYFIFDLSASGSFGSSKEKKNRGIEVAASLMFSALRNNDNVGLLAFTDHIEKYVPARKGKKHVLSLVHSLVSHNPESKRTDLAAALDFACRVLKRKSLIFIISDFLCPDFSRELMHLSKRHDVVAIRITDPREKGIPDVGLIRLEDEETGEQIIVDTSDRSFCERFTALMSEERVRLQDLFKRHAVDYVQLEADEPYVTALRRLFNARKRRLVR